MPAIILTALAACASRPEAATDPLAQGPSLQDIAQTQRPCGATGELPIPPTSLDVAPAEYRRLFEAALHVLREEGFLLDRQDYRLGVVTTRPLAAPTLFEPWHSSNKTAAMALESTLNDQRRLVRVQLMPRLDLEAEVEAYDLIVAVRIERRQHALQRLEGSTDPSRIIGSLASSSPGARDYWRSMGRDVALEQDLLARIVRRSIRLNSP